MDNKNKITVATDAQPATIDTLIATISEQNLPSLEASLGAPVGAEIVDW